MGTAYYGVSPIGLSVVHLMNDLQVCSFMSNDIGTLVTCFVSTRSQQDVSTVNTVKEPVPCLFHAVLCPDWQHHRGSG